MYFFATFVSDQVRFALGFLETPENRGNTNPGNRGKIT